jgi:hypothetical protein
VGRMESCPAGGRIEKIRRSDLRVPRARRVRWRHDSIGVSKFAFNNESRGRFCTGKGAQLTGIVRSAQAPSGTENQVRAGLLGAMRNPTGAAGTADG